jgi:hypothetical protein
MMTNIPYGFIVRGAMIRKAKDRFHSRELLQSISGSQAARREGQSRLFQLKASD